MTDPLINAWRYKDHGDENWSYADGPVGVPGGADIIEPLFSAPVNGGQAYLAGYDGGQIEMWKRMRDLVEGRLAVYFQKEKESDPLASDEMNEHEKYRHTREAMERLMDDVLAGSPKKTINFESGTVSGASA